MTALFYASAGEAPGSPVCRELGRYRLSTPRASAGQLRPQQLSRGRTGSRARRVPQFRDLPARPQTGHRTTRPVTPAVEAWPGERSSKRDVADRIRMQEAGLATYLVRCSSAEKAFQLRDQPIW